MRRGLPRVTAGPLMARAVAFGSGIVALLLAVPGWLLDPRIVVGMSLLALIAAVVPATPWVSILEYLAVLAWLGTTTVFRYEIAPAQLLGLAVAVYLHHSACALAAALPVDAVVDPRVLLDWGLRATAVTAVSVPLGLLALRLPDLTGRSGEVVVPLLGLVALVLAGFGLVQLARRSG